MALGRMGPDAGACTRGIGGSHGVGVGVGGCCAPHVFILDIRPTGGL